MSRFQALNVPRLTEEVAQKLEIFLNNQPGVEAFTISVEKRQFHIIFDQTQIGFEQLARVLANAGCPLQTINAALFK